MVVAAEHDRADLAVAHHLVELEADGDAAGSVLVEDARLAADHQAVFLGVADPQVVVAVLAAPPGVDATTGPPSRWTASDCIIVYLSKCRLMYLIF